MRIPVLLKAMPTGNKNYRAYQEHTITDTCGHCLQADAYGSHLWRKHSSQLLCALAFTVLCVMSTDMVFLWRVYRLYTVVGVA
jgi:hypothetical protein